MATVPSYQDSNRIRLRDEIISAARKLAVTHGWAKVRMVEVARTVGVSRQTVYNEFGDRAGLAESLAEYEVQRFVDTVRSELSAHDGHDVREAGRATILRVLVEANENAFVRSILASGRGGAEELLPYLTTRAALVFVAAGEVVTGWITANLPEVGSDAAALAAESIIRLTVSHVVQPSGSPEMSAAALAEVFVRLLR